MESEVNRSDLGLENGVQGYDHVVVLEGGDRLLGNFLTEGIHRVQGFAVHSGGIRTGERWFFVKHRPVALALALSLGQVALSGEARIYAATHEVKFNWTLDRDVLTLTVGRHVTPELRLEDRELLQAFADGQHGRKRYSKQP